jgi:hypothetical protein
MQGKKPPQIHLSCTDISNTVIKLDLKEKPERIWYLDECGLIIPSPANSSNAVARNQMLEINCSKMKLLDLLEFILSKICNWSVISK